MKKAMIISSGINANKLLAAIHKRGHHDVAIVNTKGEMATDAIEFKKPPDIIIKEVKTEDHFMPEKNYITGKKLPRLKKKKR